MMLDCEEEELYSHRKQLIRKNVIHISMGWVTFVQLTHLNKIDMVGLLSLIVCVILRSKFLHYGSIKNYKKTNFYYHVFVCFICLAVCVDMLRLPLGLVRESDHLGLLVASQKLNSSRFLFVGMSVMLVPILSGLDLNVIRTIAIIILVLMLHMLRKGGIGEQTFVGIQYLQDKLEISQCGCFSWYNYAFLLYESASDNVTCSDEKSGTTFQHDLYIRATLRAASILQLHDFCCVVALLCLSWNTFIVAVKKETDYLKVSSANRSADLVLNHILKNSIASAATMIEVDGDESGQLSANQQLALIHLHRSMKSCASKQILDDVARGSYHSSRTACDIHFFLKHSISLPASNDGRTLIDIRLHESTTARIPWCSDVGDASSSTSGDSRSKSCCSNDNDEISSIRISPEVDMIAEVDGQLLVIGINSAISYMLFNGYDREDDQDVKSRVSVSVYFDQDQRCLCCEIGGFLSAASLRSILVQKQVYNANNKKHQSVKESCNCFINGIKTGIALFLLFLKEHILGYFYHHLQHLQQKVSNNVNKQKDIYKTERSEKSGAKNSDVENVGLVCQAVGGSHMIYINQEKRKISIELMFPSKLVKLSNRGKNVGYEAHPASSTNHGYCSMNESSPSSSSSSSPSSPLSSGVINSPNDTQKRTGEQEINISTTEINSTHDIPSTNGGTTMIKEEEEEASIPRLPLQYVSCLNGSEKSSRISRKDKVDYKKIRIDQSDHGTNADSGMSVSQQLMVDHSDRLPLLESSHVATEGFEFPSQLRVFAIDDSEMMCKGYVKLLLPQLKADISNSEVCCPKNMSQVQQFIQQVLYGAVNVVTSPAVSSLGYEFDIFCMDGIGMVDESTCISYFRQETLLTLEKTMTPTNNAIKSNDQQQQHVLTVDESSEMLSSKEVQASSFNMPDDKDDSCDGHNDKETDNILDHNDSVHSCSGDSEKEDCLFDLLPATDGFCYYDDFKFETETMISGVSGSWSSFDDNYQQPTNNFEGVVSNTCADICILDQNIVLPGSTSFKSETVLGTDIARELRRRGFAGMIVIRSADDSSAFINNTLAGEVDFTLGKSEPYTQFIQKIKFAYTNMRNRKRKPVEVFSEHGSFSADASSSTMRFKKAAKH